MKDNYQLEDRKPLVKYLHKNLRFQAVLLKIKTRLCNVRRVNTNIELVFVSVKCLSDENREYDHFVYHCTDDFVIEHDLKVGRVYLFNARIESYYTSKRIVQSDGTISIASAKSYGINDLGKFKLVKNPKRYISKWAKFNLKRLSLNGYDLLTLTKQIKHQPLGQIELSIMRAIDENHLHQRYTSEVKLSQLI